MQIAAAGAPTVTAISPTGGPLAGGTAVTISGTGFVSGATVTIGGASATSVVFGSATSITAVTPSGTAGATSVVVTNPDTQSGTGTGLYSVAAATASTLTPTSASVTVGGVMTQLLTVTAKDSRGTNLTSGGAIVTITKSSGTGTISAVTDVGNGTYTAVVTSPTTPGSGVFVATLNGAAVTSGSTSQTEATVTYVALGSCISSVGPGIAAPTSVPSGIPGFHAAWYGQSGYMTLCPGETATATVAIYNSGSRGWVSGVMGEVAYLGTWNPSPGQDQPSTFGGDGTLGSPNTGWPRYNRVASQPAAYVGPNQVAWFQFSVKAPTTPGIYGFHIRPLIEGAQWMEDYGIFWQITVPEPPLA